MDTLPGAKAPIISAKSNELSWGLEGLTHDALLGIPYLRDTTLRSCKKQTTQWRGQLGAIMLDLLL